jgi:hypothetical protein
VSIGRNSVSLRRVGVARVVELWLTSGPIAPLSDRDIGDAAADAL